MALDGHHGSTETPHVRGLAGVERFFDSDSVGLKAALTRTGRPRNFNTTNTRVPCSRSTAFTEVLKAHVGGHQR